MKFVQVLVESGRIRWSVKSSGFMRVDDDLQLKTMREELGKVEIDQPSKAKMKLEKQAITHYWFTPNLHNVPPPFTCSVNDTCLKVHDYGKLSWQPSSQCQ